MGEKWHIFLAMPTGPLLLKFCSEKFMPEKSLVWHKQRGRLNGIKVAWRVCVCYIKFLRRAGTKGYGQLCRLGFRLIHLGDSSMKA